ncbi:PhoX family protein [bacterium]|nr:PhoX family protein [bacterium]
MKFRVLLVLVSVVFASGSSFSDDFGQSVENKLRANSVKLFGIKKPLDGPAPASVVPYRTQNQVAEDQVALAKGLSASYLTRNAGNAADMIAFYPATSPTHIVICVEGDREIINPGTGKLNPSVQRINLSIGVVETILRGMEACDGIRTTAWGTVIASEETSDGAVYEILNPLTATEISITDRTAGTVTDPTQVAKRTAMMAMAWEGIAVLPSGVVIAGDELRPGTANPDDDGGAIFKFIPSSPFPGGDPITDLANSPLVAGSAFAMRISCTTGTQYGQGCEIGAGKWVSVNASNARADANANGATGYYRPEDLHPDPVFSDATLPNAVRFCWTNTGNEAIENFAEVLCAVDEDPILPTSAVTANRFVEGDFDFNSFDNLDFQPNTGILYVVEDHANGEIFACLRDGLDRDIKTDGCIRVLSVKDTSAEPTGFIFAPDGKTAYLNIQHSDDTNMPLLDDYGTDDVLVITGFKDVKP